MRRRRRSRRASTPKPAPFGVSFTGMACSEPRLIELAYAFEQATKRRVPPPVCALDVRQPIAHRHEACVRFLLAIEWMLATTVAVVAHLSVEIAGAALLGYTLLFLLPIIGGVVGGLPVAVLQWMVLRRHVAGSGLWIPFTLLGFFGAWTAAVILAAVLFVPLNGLDRFRAFLSFAVPTPFIGWSQSTVLRRWSPHTRFWVAAQHPAGWGRIRRGRDFSK